MTTLVTEQDSADRKPTQFAEETWRLASVTPVTHVTGTTLNARRCITRTAGTGRPGW
jgi:hypothetical protein